MPESLIKNKMRAQVTDTLETTLLPSLFLIENEDGRVVSGVQDPQAQISLISN